MERFVRALHGVCKSSVELTVTVIDCCLMFHTNSKLIVFNSQAIHFNKKLLNRNHNGRKVNWFFFSITYFF
jgi:hypothetical protein